MRILSPILVVIALGWLVAFVGSSGFNEAALAKEPQRLAGKSSPHIESVAEPALSRLGGGPARAFRFRGGKVAWCLIAESNKYVEKRGSVDSFNFAVSTGHDAQILVALMRSNLPVELTRLPSTVPTVYFACVEKQSTQRTSFPFYFYRYARPDRDFPPVTSREVDQHLTKPVSPRIGQAVTLWQVGMQSPMKNAKQIRPHLTKEPLAELLPLPAMKNGDPAMARITLQVMFLDPNWTADSKEVKAFFDIEKRLKRNTEGQ